MKRVVLKKGKERAIENRHPWLFSGAIHSIDDAIPDGAIVPIASFRNSILAWGYINRKSHITIRVLSFGEAPFSNDTLYLMIQSAIEKRKRDPLLAQTHAYRVIHSEGDSLPGLIVDFYSGHLVIQSLTLGIDRLRDDIVQMLIELLKPESIFERSDHAGRAAEGLEMQCTQLFGTTPDEIIIEENGMRFSVDVKNGQKTGFFLDQRENRKTVRLYARDKQVLNLFSYSGGFSVAAMAGGAQKVVSVDSSKRALELLHKNTALNDIIGPMEVICDDVFDFLPKYQDHFDFIILDPPALAKSRRDIPAAERGYRELHLQAFRRCAPDAYLFSCSCSRFIDMKDFQKIVFSAAAKNGRRVQIVGKYHQPGDHPVNIFAPETEYLKAMLLHVE